jgi:uncharacterized protein (DUF2235 family)
VSVGGDSDQLLFYEPGVGVTPDERLIGGGFGYGLSHNIRSAYRFLVKEYEPGDDLFLFGFSRGAYTARSLAGLIRNCGILRADAASQVDAAFAFYRDRTSTTHPSSLASEIFRRMYAHDSADIHFIGVWDTVGALGIPSNLPGWKECSRIYRGWEHMWGFHDTQLSSHVRYAYQALAIDEEREPFRPCLWTQDPDPGQQTLEQVWFSGVHTEVGGGSSSSSLSDIALLWLVGRAQQQGLRLDTGLLSAGGQDGAGGKVAPDYAAPIANSRTGIYKLLRPFHRLRRLHVEDAPGQAVGFSACRRYQERIDSYAPPGLDDYLAVLNVIPEVEETGTTAVPALRDVPMSDSALTSHLSPEL